MGQYYKPCILNKENHVEKFMLSWDFDNGLKLMEHSWQGNNFVEHFESLIYENPCRVVWAGDYADVEEDTGKNIYSSASENEHLKVIPEKSIKARYVVNHTKKLYVDKEEVPENEYGWKIHPLPLLTCEGNGQGGGDYYGESDLVGTWARDLISVEDKVPEGYEKINFNLIG